jgi:NhaP-type Na+/H+ or K+/H+ antiporter
MGYVLKRLWGEDASPIKETKISFELMMPFLFSCTGAAVNLKLVTPRGVAYSFLHIFVGLISRFFGIFLLTGAEKGKFNWKERMFIGFSYLTKNNTAATISGTYIAEAKTLGIGAQHIEWGIIMQSTGVLVIIVAVSIGTFLMGFTAPRLLEKHTHEEVEAWKREKAALRASIK